MTAHLPLGLTHGPPPDTSLLGKPGDLVDTLRSSVRINLSCTAHLGGKFQEAVEWAAPGGQGVRAELGFARLGTRHAVLVDRLHVRLREAMPPFVIHEFALRGDVTCFGTECLWIGDYQGQMEPIVSRGGGRSGGGGCEDRDNRKSGEAIEKNLPTGRDETVDERERSDVRLFRPH